LAGGVGQGTSAFLAGKYGKKAGMEDADLLRLIP
jgi:hypothetical protein